MRGFLKDGPAAGHVVEVGDPPRRRGVIVLDADGFGEDAHRYYLCALDSSGAVYTHFSFALDGDRVSRMTIRQ